MTKEEQEPSTSKRAKVENEPAEDLPEVDESTVNALSEQVRASLHILSDHRLLV